MAEQWAWRYVLDEETRVLVVDDNPILREFAAVHLSTPTATVEGAPDGAEALRLLAAQRFEIAIRGSPAGRVRSDDGHERLCVDGGRQRCRRDTRSARAIRCAEEADRAHAWRVGMDQLNRDTEKRALTAIR
jgi:CheY-like chemotaxis protein